MSCYDDKVESETVGANAAKAKAAPPRCNSLRFAELRSADWISRLIALFVCGGRLFGIFASLWLC